MSQADDVSILAMQAARMSPASIALTMGWSEARTVRRLRALNCGEADAVRASVAPAKPPFAVPPLAAPAPEEDDGAADDMDLDNVAVAPGQGLVIRAFEVRPTGYGADCRLADGRRVFTLTGAARQAPGARIAVEQGEGVWVMVGEGRA